MAISGNETKIVLQSERGDPKIVVRNWSSGSLELNEKARIVFRRFLAEKQYAYGGLGEHSVQQDFIPALLSATKKTGLHFAQDNERNPDLFRSLQFLGKFRIATEQIGDPIGIERNPHFHLSGSICLWLAMMSSNAGSGVH
jgi:hypothetical protein